MSTKLCIPYNVKAGKGSQFLIVYANQKRNVLACSLLARLWMRGLSSREYLVILRLVETLDSKLKSVIYRLLYLSGQCPKSKPALKDHFNEGLLYHIEWGKLGKTLKGDIKSQMARVEHQLKLSFKVVQEKKVKPSQLRWMGIGYRDKGSTSTYSFSWKELSGRIQDDHSSLFARDDNVIINIAIQKARQDLKAFSVGLANSDQGIKIPDEIPRRELKRKDFFEEEGVFRENKFETTVKFKKAYKKSDDALEKLSLLKAFDSGTLLDSDKMKKLSPSFLRELAEVLESKGSLDKILKNTDQKVL